jgi:FixJ family two-component response regulator
MTEPIVFIVSEDAQVRQSVKTLVESAGLQAGTFATLQALIEAKEPDSHGCLVFYPRSNSLGDPAQQARLTAACAGLPGILITERGDVPMAVQAMKAGITDVVQKPCRDEALLERIVKALATHAPV